MHVLLDFVDSLTCFIMTVAMPIPAPPHIRALLDRLHAKSLEQEHILAKEGMGQADFDSYMRDKFIALEQDKCEFVYTLARATSAKTIVEVSRSRLTVAFLSVVRPLRRKADCL